MQVDRDTFCDSQLLTYLGNKRKLRATFTKLFGQRADRPMSFLDGFAGSGAVSRMAKTTANVTDLYSNDWEPYANVVNSCYLQNVDDQTCLNISREIEILNTASRCKAESERHFIYGNYTPREHYFIREGERAFFTPENGKIIDRLRQRINGYRDFDKYYFLGPLLYRASVHNNTCGYFNSFYKKDGVGHFGGKHENDLGRICTSIHLDNPIFFNSWGCRVHVLQNDISHVLPHVYVDVAYYDPPYNKHPYGTYYHMLNTIAEYPCNESVAPNLRGQTHDWKRSAFNSFKSAETEFASLIENTNAHTVWISYNTRGILSLDFITRTLQQYGSVEVNTFEHPTYAKLLGQGKKFRKKPCENEGVVREHFFVMNRKRS